MDEEQNSVMKRIIKLTLEIIYLLTGEDYMVVKKTSGGSETADRPPTASQRWSRAQESVMEFYPPSLIPGLNDHRKILDITHMITEQLTGEVLIRSQDVAVYFSMEEREYLEENKEFYKDAIMEDQQIPLLLDGSISRDSAQRSPHPCDSQDSPQEDHNIPHHYQDFGRECVPVAKQQVTPAPEREDGVLLPEEEYVKVEQIDEEEISAVLVTDEEHKDHTEKHPVISLDGEIQNDIICCPPDGIPFDPFLLPEHHNASLSHNPATQGECFPYYFNPVPDQTAIREPEKFQCAECGKCFSCKSALITHGRVHTGEKPYSCSICGKNFSQKSNLIAHTKLHTGEKPYSCTACGKFFSQKSNLITHEKVHTGEKPYSCSECGKCFSKKGLLSTHERIHTGEKPYSCVKCGKCFSHKGTLITHERIHTGEKPYSCSECGKCFSQQSRLVNHKQIHSGEKPYSCSECGKCFYRKYKLFLHERVHTGVKPYSCSECEKCFSQKSDLKIHNRVHTGEKQYCCPECGKCFSHKGNLLKHERTHAGEKTYSCSECGLCFSHKSSLVNHKKIHSEEWPYS